MKAINYFVFSALVLLAWSCGSESNTNESKSYTLIDSHRVIEDSAYYEIDLEFPVFVGNEGENSLDELNSAISEFLDTAAIYYWGIPPDSVRAEIEKSEASGTYVLNNKYTVLDTSAHRISIMMETYSYALGAHGFTALHTYNFDVEHNKMLNIGDIIDLSNEKNIVTLNALLAANFDNPEDCFTRSPSADADFQLFGLRPENLVFYYEAYELGAYSCGMAKVSIPISSLIEAGLWKEKG
jgi:hypothetical protein